MQKKNFENFLNFFFAGAARRWRGGGAAAARRRRGLCRAYGKKSYLCHKLHFKCLHQTPQHFINNSMKQDQNTLN